MIKHILLTLPRKLLGYSITVKAKVVMNVGLPVFKFPAQFTQNTFIHILDSFFSEFLPHNLKVRNGEETSGYEEFWWNDIRKRKEGGGTKIPILSTMDKFSELEFGTAVVIAQTFRISVANIYLYFISFFLNRSWQFIYCC